jgi:CRISPR-associated protein (TIGR02584 family)
VLVVVAGSAAEVVGQTLSAIVDHDRSSVDELHVLASVRTGRRLREELLRSSGGAPPLADLCAHLGILRSDILFASRTIHLLGQPDEPLRLGGMADDMLEAMRDLCTRDNLLTVVVAPDARPLGLLAYAALALVGRPRDRLFFLEIDRTAAAPAARTRGGRRAAGQAGGRGVLLNVPIVLAAEPIQSSDTFQTMADTRRRARLRLQEPGAMFLDGRRHVVRIDDVDIAMPSRQFFWLFVIATRAPATFPLKALSGNFHVDAHGHITITASSPERETLAAVVAGAKKLFTILFPGAAEEFARVLTQACGPSPGLPSIVAKINRRLKHVLGIGAVPYVIAGGRSAGGYRLTLPPEVIETDPRVGGLHART